MEAEVDVLTADLRERNVMSLRILGTVVQHIEALQNLLPQPANMWGRLIRQFQEVVSVPADVSAISHATAATLISSILDPAK